MDKSELVINKLLNQTAKDNTSWHSYASFPTDKTMPYYGYQHLIPEESYLYSTGEDGYFFLATFKVMDFENDKTVTELILGFKKTNSNFEKISDNQKKLFELKALIEYEEPAIDLTISDILDQFLSDTD